MIRYVNKGNNFIYVIEIPNEAEHNENTVKCVDKVNACYTTNKYIIRNCIYTPSKFRLLYYNNNLIYERYVFYFMTYDRALQEINFDKLQNNKTVDRYDFPSVFRTYYNSGEIQKEFYHIKGIINGKYIHYDEDDKKILCECNFINGIINGECIVYDEKNDFYRKYYFIDGNILNKDSYYDYEELDKYIIPIKYQIKK
jgi:hypothetical protein